MKKLISILLVICLISIPSVVFADDAAPKSYAELNYKIQDALEQGALNQTKTVTIKLDSDYCYSPDSLGDSDLLPGITIRYNYEGFPEYKPIAGGTGSHNMEKENIFVDYPQVIIDGDGHTIDGYLAARVFQITDKARVIIKNLTFINSRGQSEEFKNNFHDVGGAVAVKNESKVYFENCNFISCQAIQNGWGGAIFATDDSTLIINGCTFDDSYAQDGGDILGILDGRLATVYNSNITADDVFNDKADRGYTARINLFSKTDLEFTVTPSEAGSTATITITKPAYFEGTADLAIGDKIIKDIQFGGNNPAAELDLGLAPGTYTATLSAVNFAFGKDISRNIYDMCFEAFANSNEFTVKKAEAQLKAVGATASYNETKYATFNLKSGDKALSAYTVNVNLNGKTSAYKTNSNGQIRVSTEGLKPGSYNAVATFPGNAEYEKCTATAKIVIRKATPKLKATAKTYKANVKTKKYTVTLRNNKNKAIKNGKVRIKVGGKTYSAKTNAKGTATLKITRLSKKGRFKATVKYGGNSLYKSVTKKTEITVK